ncbi:hypothetical protein [Alloalcanivorax xenomutans]|uniref:hypothetical protein n=1 Tax=Alloalcanivorax xenomutans TaxID=1094342 RepID=UPI003BAD7AE2
MSERQRTMPLLGVVNAETADIDPVAVAGCSHWAQAFRLCLRQSRVKRDQRSWADLLGMSVGTLNTLLNADHHTKRGARVRHLDMDLVVEIEELAGNNAISQYQQMRKARQLHCQRGQVSPEQELAELRARVAQLEALAG